jgi:excisionase family DNA binding protein
MWTSSSPHEGEESKPTGGNMPSLDSVEFEDSLRKRRERWVIIPERWYTVDETAEFLNCGRDKVIRLVEQGHLTASVFPGKSSRRARIYKQRRILGAEIIRFLAENIR